MGPPVLKSQNPPGESCIRRYLTPLLNYGHQPDTATILQVFFRFGATELPLSDQSHVLAR